MLFPALSLSQTSQTEVHAQLGTATAVAEHALYAVGEFAELNLAAAAASLQDSQILIRRVSGARDVPQVLQTLQGEALPAAEKMVSYARHASEIGAQMQADVANAFHARVAETFTHLNGLVASLVSVAPPGMEPVAEAAKAHTASVQMTYDKLAKANQQMLDGYHHQLLAFAEQFTAPDNPAKSAKLKKASVAVND